MSCANHCCGIDEMFDPAVAARELSSYRRSGPRASTRRLLAAIRQAGASGVTVLDVGGGIGVVAHELVAAGASRATVVDASAAFIDAARDEARRRGENGRVELVHGDFLALAASLPPADVVTLDRVVCCHPDMSALLGASAAHARRMLGLVYPRDGWWIRVGVAAQNFFRRIRGSAFRVYVYEESAIDDELRGAGLRRRARHGGLVWITALYERVPAS